MIYKNSGGVKTLLMNKQKAKKAFFFALKIKYYFLFLLGFFFFFLLPSTKNQIKKTKRSKNTNQIMTCPKG